MTAMLPTERTVPNSELSNKIILLYGKPKVGKSTLASKFPGAVFAATEPGLKYLSVHQTPIADWLGFAKMCHALMETEHDFKTLVVDTIDLLWDMLCDYIAKKHGHSHISDFTGWGKGYSMAKQEMTRVLTKVANMPTKKGHGMGLVLVSHANEVEDDGKLVWMPSLSKAPRLVLTAMSDIICFADIYQNSEGGIGRTLRLAPHPKFVTGGRIHNLPDVIGLEYTELAQAIQSAIKGDSNE